MDLVQLEMFSLLVETQSWRELLPCVLTTHGALCVQIHGISWLLLLYADNWATHRWVSHSWTFHLGCDCYSHRSFLTTTGVQTTTSYYSSYAGRRNSVTAYLRSVNCNGTESSLLNCNHTALNYSFTHGYCKSGNMIADIVCQEQGRL